MFPNLTYQQKIRTTRIANGKRAIKVCTVNDGNITYTESEIKRNR